MDDMIRRSEAQKPFDKTGWKNQRLEGYEVWHYLDGVPAVDAAEVVHAEWVYDGFDEYHCTIVEQFGL